MTGKWIAGREFNTREEAEDWARSGISAYVIIDPWTDEQIAAMRLAFNFLSDGAWNDQHYEAMRLLADVEDRFEK